MARSVRTRPYHSILGLYHIFFAPSRAFREKKKGVCRKDLCHLYNAIKKRGQNRCSPPYMCQILKIFFRIGRNIPLAFIVIIFIATPFLSLPLYSGERKMLPLFVPVVLVLQRFKKIKIAPVPFRGNATAGDRFKYRTAVLLRVCAFSVSAFPDIWQKFGKCTGEIVFCEEIKTPEIEHGKAGSVGNVAASDPEQLYLAGRVPTAFGFFADRPGFKGKLRKKCVQQSRFARTGRSRECRDAAARLSGDKAFQPVKPGAVYRVGDKDRYCTF